MTNTADLRAAALAATPGPWAVDPVNEYLIGPDRSFLHWDHDGLGAIWENRADATFIALASPDRILAICEELERKTAALERIHALLHSPATSDGVEEELLLARIVEVAEAALEGKP